jgi:hypothetical protein
MHKIMLWDTAGMMRMRMEEEAIRLGSQRQHAINTKTDE